MQKKNFEKLPVFTELWLFEKTPFLLVPLQRTCLKI